MGFFFFFVLPLYHFCPFLHSVCLSSPGPSLQHSAALRSVCLAVMRRAGTADIKLTGAVRTAEGRPGEEGKKKRKKRKKERAEERRGEEKKEEGRRKGRE